MLLNHLNIAVDEVEPAEAFLRKHFSLEPVGRRTSKMAGLKDENGFALVLMQGAPAGPRGLHIGFHQSSDEAVNEIHAQLAADGVDAPAPRRMHGAWAFYFSAPGGIYIEVSH
jgi:catechol 2,3-dioxygenase-like lactoylglutathione lyase family enzyme